MPRTTIPVLAVLFVGLTAASASRLRAEPIRFSEHLIMDGYSYPYGLSAADLDKDGDLDLISPDAYAHSHLYWFDNDGHGKFTKRYIQRDDPQRLERHAVVDLDADGDLDVVIVKNKAGHVIWFENNGSPKDGELWKRREITTDLPGAYDVTVADFDADGDLDVASSSWILGNQFAWFENVGVHRQEPWPKHMVDQNAAETREIQAADFDADGDADLLGTATGANLLLWYENTGKIKTRGWERHVIERRLLRPMHGQAADIDRDGDLDVLMAFGMSARSSEPNSHQIVWYENDGTPAEGPWARHVIARHFTDAIEAAAADLDGDKDIDIVASSWREPGRVAWFENRGDPKGSWTKHVLKDDWRSANQVIIADLDNDSRPDIAAVAERGTAELRWWRNDGK